MVGLLKGRPWVVAAAALTAIFVFYLLIPSDTLPSPSRILPYSRPTYPEVCEQPLNNGSWEFVSERDERNLGLTDEQCQVRLISADSNRISLTHLQRLPFPNNTSRSNELANSTKPKAA